MENIPVTRDVLGLDLGSRSKVGEDREWSTARDTHLTQVEDILNPGEDEIEKTVLQSSIARNFASHIYHKPNYGPESESHKCPNSGDCPRVETTFWNNIGESWKNGLFDCHKNKTIAAVVTCCPCVAFGHIAEVLDEGEMTCPMGSFIYVFMMLLLCSQWMIGSEYRKKLRRKLNLVEAPYEDWASHIFCHYCSLCQEYRELQNRGLDPSLGWKGILARQQAMQQRPQDLVQCPPRTQDMSR